MSRRRKHPSLYRFEEADADVDLEEAPRVGRSLTSVKDIEAMVEELCVQGASGDPGDLDELSAALHVAIDGLEFLQHVLESRAGAGRARRQTRTH